jgi:hypothetical protein
MLYYSSRTCTLGVNVMLINFNFKEGDERLSSHTGLALVGALLNRTSIRERLSDIEVIGCPNPTIVHGDVIYSMIGLLSLGKTDFDAIEPFRKDPFFCESLGIENCPSAPTLRQRLELVKESFDDVLKQESARLVQKTALKITPIMVSQGALVPLDIDVSPFDNSKTQKEGVSRTYKGFDGYAPIFAYVGQEGYLANLELREGKQHCQRNTPEFLQSSIVYSKMMTDEEFLVRLDSGNDSIDNVKVCIKEEVQWLIKRNLRKESPEEWLEIAKEQGQCHSPRPGKTVWTGAVYRDIKGIDKPLRIVYEVTERTIIKDQFLLVPEIEVDTYWSSLEDTPAKIIELYHDHGTSEQFHSEIKSDMGLERLPSSDFQTNALVLLLAMAAYNVLRLCGQESLREDNGNIEIRPSYRRKVKRSRLRTVIQDFLYIASRLTLSCQKMVFVFRQILPLCRDLEKDLF